MEAEKVDQECVVQEIQNEEEEIIASNVMKDDGGDEGEGKWIDVGDGDGGVMKRILEEGEGESKPPKGSEVKVHYTGRLEDGTVFDSSKERDEPFKFKLGKGQVIKGWDKGIATMRKGERSILKVRPDYGYGDKAQGKIPPNSTLLFEVEMISWKAGEKITSDGGVSKIQTIADGEGYKKPKDPLWARVSFTLSKVSEIDGSKDVLRQQDDFTFTLGEDAVFSGLEKAVESMILHEHSLFSISDPKYLPFDLFPPDVPNPLTSSSSVIFHLDVHLLEFENEKPSWEMSVREKIEAANYRKDQATEFFKQQKYQVSIRRYAKAADFINYKHDFSDDEKNEATTIENAIHLNRAAAFLKLSKWSDAIQECDKVLKNDSLNVKALYRKALALEQNLDWDEADLLFKKVLEITPDDAAVKRERSRLQKKVADYERSQAQRYRKLFA